MDRNARCVGHARAINPAIEVLQLSARTGATKTDSWVDIDGGIGVYGVSSHRHTPEIEQSLTRAAGEAVAVTFTLEAEPASTVTVWGVLMPSASR